jgi:hypothetical protein
MNKISLTRTVSAVVIGALGAVFAAGIYTEASRAPDQS